MTAFAWLLGSGVLYVIARRRPARIRRVVYPPVLVLASFLFLLGLLMVLDPFTHASGNRLYVAWAAIDPWARWSTVLVGLVMVIVAVLIAVAGATGHAPRPPVVDAPSRGAAPGPRIVVPGPRDHAPRPPVTAEFGRPQVPARIGAGPPTGRAWPPARVDPWAGPRSHTNSSSGQRRR